MYNIRHHGWCGGPTSSAEENSTKPCYPGCYAYLWTGSNGGSPENLGSERGSRNVDGSTFHHTGETDTNSPGWFSQLIARGSSALIGSLVGIRMS